MARSSEVALALIDRIYEAAIDFDRWPGVLVALTDAVGGAQVMMGINDPGGECVAVAPRMDPAHVASYLEHWGEHDILWRRTNSAAVGEILHAERFVPREELQRTGFYNDWYRPLGLGAAGLGVNLYVHDGVPAVCGIKRSRRKDEFSPDEVALFEAVAPHLVRAVDIQRRLRTLELAQAAATAAAGGDGNCILVVDAAAGTVCADGGAEQLLDERGGLQVVGGRLAATDRTAAADLARLLGRCARRDGDNRSAGGSMRIRRGRGRSPLRVDVTPVPPGRRTARAEWLGPSAALALVSVTDPDRAGTLPRRRLRHRFGLTPAEARLAVEIGKGDGREAAAARLGISVGTARTHLVRIFDKTGVRRQAELVRLVMQLTRAHG